MSVRPPRGLCVPLGRPHLAPALGLAGVKELLSIGEAAWADLINSTRIKQLCHKGFCCLRSLSMKEERGVTERPRESRPNQL